METDYLQVLRVFRCYFDGRINSSSFKILNNELTKRILKSKESTSLSTQNPYITSEIGLMKGNERDLLFTLQDVAM